MRNLFNIWLVKSTVFLNLCLTAVLADGISFSFRRYFWWLLVFSVGKLSTLLHGEYIFLRICYLSSLIVLSIISLLIIYQKFTSGGFLWLPWFTITIIIIVIIFYNQHFKTVDAIYFGCFCIIALFEENILDHLECLVWYNFFGCKLFYFQSPEFISIMMFLDAFSSNKARFFRWRIPLISTILSILGKRSLIVFSRGELFSNCFSIKLDVL